MRLPLDPRGEGCCHARAPAHSAAPRSQPAMPHRVQLVVGGLQHPTTRGRQWDERGPLGWEGRRDGRQGEGAAEMGGKGRGHRIYTTYDISGQDGLRWVIWTLRWATITRGGPSKITVSVNDLPRWLHYNNQGKYVLTEVVILHCPPR